MHITGVDLGEQNHIAGTRPDPRIAKAAHEFEAQIMKELLAPLTASSETEEDQDGGSSGALGSFASESLGRALSMSGGFGIAHRLISSLSHSGNSSKTAVVTSAAHRNTGVGQHE